MEIADRGPLTWGCAAHCANPKLTNSQLELDRSLNSDAINACVANMIETSALDISTPAASQYLYKFLLTLVVNHSTTKNIPASSTTTTLATVLFEVLGGHGSFTK